MSKFLQLADDIDSDLREMDNDADELNARRLVLKERARVAVNTHHSGFNRVEEGLDALERIGRELSGSNSDKAALGKKAADDIAAAKANLAKEIEDQKAKVDAITAEELEKSKRPIAPDWTMEKNGLAKFEGKVLAEGSLTMPNNGHPLTMPNNGGRTE